MGEMRIITSMAQDEVKKLPPHMRRSGDSKVIWDPKNDDEVEAAQAQFDVLIDKGFKAYKVDKKGDKTGSPIKTFNPKVGKLIMVPAIQGG
jgi:ribosomal protein L19E